MEELAHKEPLVDVVDVVEGDLEVPYISWTSLEGFFYKITYEKGKVGFYVLLFMKAQTLPSKMGQKLKWVRSKIFFLFRQFRRV